MIHIDPELKRKLAQNIEQPVAAIVSCEGKCEEVIERLKSAGVIISSTESMLVGIIMIQLTRDQLEHLESAKIPGLLAIEYDRETRIMK
jgi:hypothetical protein